MLSTIKDAIEHRGYPPSMREIGEAVGLTSTSSVAHQLRVLEQKGYLKRDPNRPRALEVFLPEVMAARRSLGSAEETSYDETGIGDVATPASTCRCSAGSRPVARSSPRRTSTRSSRCPSSSSATASSSCSRCPASR